MNLKTVFASLFMGALSTTAVAAGTDAYDFQFKTLSEQATIKLSDYKGKVILIVNTASKCGFTPQYAALEKLYKTYKDRGLVILGVPSNDFGQQEPGTNQEIAHFCQINYGVTFPMTAKVDVIGKTAHPFFVWARETLGFGSAPKWNFYKYLVDRQGKLIDYYTSVTKPDSEKFIKAVEAALNAP
jgi:glutathione peroxidase